MLPLASISTYLQLQFKCNPAPGDHTVIVSVDLSEGLREFLKVAKGQGDWHLAATATTTNKTGRPKARKEGYSKTDVSFCRIIIFRGISHEKLFRPRCGGLPRRDPRILPAAAAPPKYT